MAKKIFLVLGIYYLFLLQVNGQVKEIKPNNPWLATGELYYTQGNFPLALNAFNQYLKLDALNIEGLYWRGLVEARMLRFNEAFSDLNLANRLYPKQTKIMAALSEIYDYFGEYEKAYRLISKTLELESSNLNYINTEGLILLHQKKFNAAFLRFNEIISQDSTNAAAYNNRGTARFNNQSISFPSKEDLTNAELDFSKAIDINPNFAMAYRNRGVVRMNLNELNTAYQDLIIARGLDPNDDKVYFNLGKVYFKLDKKQMAIESFDKAIEIANIFCEPYLERGLVYLSMNNYESGRTDFKKAILADKKIKGRAYYYMAKSFALEKNITQTTSYLKASKKTGFFKNFDNRNEFIKDADFEELMKDADFKKIRLELMNIN